MNTFLNPENILDQLNLRVDTITADFGCGSGGFTIPLAKRFTDGLVYGLDIQREPVEFLKSRSIAENVHNIRFINCDLENPRGSTLADLSVDLVVIANTLFQAENEKSMLEEAERILRDNGKLLIIDWLPDASQGPVEGRIHPDKVKKIADELNLKFLKEPETGKYHYGLLFEKP